MKCASARAELTGIAPHAAPSLTWPGCAASSHHVHVQLGCVAQGLLQHLALNHTAAVWQGFRNWLRTMNPAMPPSEWIVASVLRSSMPTILAVCTLAPELKKTADAYTREALPPQRDQIVRMAAQEKSALSRSKHSWGLAAECSNSGPTGTAEGSLSGHRGSSRVIEVEDIAASDVDLADAAARGFGLGESRQGRWRCPGHACTERAQAQSAAVPGLQRTL